MKPGALPCVDCMNDVCIMNCGAAVRYTSSPSEQRPQWFVWNFYSPLPPAPVFVGSMEECGFVVDSLNATRSNR